MSKLGYYILYILTFPVAFLPLRFGFLLSDCLYYIVYYLVGYRKKMVRKNLANSFPDKTKEELLRMEKAFFRHFCDYYFETIKLLHISDAEIEKRFVFKNAELIDYFLKEGNSVILMLGHYGNWEWVTSITLAVKGGDSTVIGQIYRPLKNKAFDSFFLKLRRRFHSVGFAKNDIYREIIKMRRANKKWLLGFISDQKPSYNGIAYWTKFLNQDTATLIGAERIAKQTDSVVCYLDITRVKRGFYEGKVKLISDNPTETPEFEITEKYMRMLEKTILRNPSFYLWSHNRWKYKKNDSE